MPLRLLARLHRNGLVAMSYLGIFYALVNSAVYPVLGGATTATQRAFGAQVSVLAQQIMWLLPAPLHPETATGYLQWRGYGVFAIAFAAWAFVAGCGTVRRDEDRGLVEAWLSAGLPRSRVLLTRAVAFALCAAAVVTATGVAGAIGCAIAGSRFPSGGLPVKVSHSGPSPLRATRSRCLWHSRRRRTAPRQAPLARSCS